MASEASCSLCSPPPTSLCQEPPCVSSLTTHLSQTPPQQPSCAQPHPHAIFLFLPLQKPTALKLDPLKIDLPEKSVTELSSEGG